MNNVSWTPEEDFDAQHLTKEAFLAKYPHRTEHGLRFRRKRLRERELEDLRPDPVADPVDEPDPEDLDAYFEKLIEADELERKLGQSTAEVAVDLGDAPVAIAFLSDTHIGAGGVEYRRLQRDLALIRDTEGLYGIFNGDVIENTKTHTKSASALYSALVSKPRHQLEWAKRLFGIADGKWLAWTQGNHDAFDYRAAGVDRIPDLAASLRVPYASEKGVTVKVTVGGVEYVIVVKHQYGGQSKISKSNSARRLWDEWPNAWENADVIALAHLHEPDQHVTLRRGRDVHWLRSGTYKCTDPWAENQGYKPTYGVPVVILFPNERKILSFHGSHFLDAVAMFERIRVSHHVQAGVEELHSEELLADGR